MAWLYVPGLVGSNSGSSVRSETFGAYVTLNGTPTLRLFSWRGWKRRSWIKRLYGTISNPSMAERGAAKWISSLLDFRVSRGAAPESSKAKRTNDGSGLTSPGSFAMFDRALSSWRMCQVSFLEEDSDQSSLIWPRSGSMRNGACFARPMSAHHIGANDGSAWPTATSQDSVGSGSADYPKTDSHNMGTTLTDAIRRWPTPRSSDHNAPGEHGDGGPDLRTMVCQHGLRDRTRKTGRESSNDGRNLRRRLNPLFVEWLMGFPIGWTACDASETP